MNFETDWHDHRLVSRERSLGERVRSGEYRTYYERNYGNRTPAVVAPEPMRVAIEATSLSLSSGGLARYTSELSLALGAMISRGRILSALRPAFPHAVGRARRI